MNKQDIQTVLEALANLHDKTSPVCFEAYGDSIDEAYANAHKAIAILPAALAEPSEPHAWEYTNVQSGFKQLQSYPPEHFEEFNDMEMWHVKPLFTHPAPSKPEPLTEDEVDSIVLQHMEDINLPEGNPLRKLNAFRDLVRAGEAAVWEKMK